MRHFRDIVILPSVSSLFLISSFYNVFNSIVYCSLPSYTPLHLNMLFPCRFCQFIHSFDHILLQLFFVLCQYKVQSFDPLILFLQSLAIEMTVLIPVKFLYILMMGQNQIRLQLYFCSTNHIYCFYIKVTTFLILLHLQDQVSFGPKSVNTSRTK